MTTPQESRELFLESIFTMDEVLDLKQRNLYFDYVEGRISIDKIYMVLREQAI